MLLPVVSVSIPLLAAYLYRVLYYHRYRKHGSFPQIKLHFLWGHLKAMHEWSQTLPANIHHDEVWKRMHQSIGRPNIMLLDFWPIQKPMVLIMNHEIAEQVTRPSKKFPLGVSKMDIAWLYGPLFGERSVAMQQGDDWRNTRKRFNPSFAPQHLFTLLPDILDKTERFLGDLDVLAGTGEEFLLDELCSNLTFDILGLVAAGIDFKTQSGPSHSHEARQLFEEIQSLIEETRTSLLPSPFRKWRLAKATQRLDYLLRGLIRQNFEDTQRETGSERTHNIISYGMRDIESLTDDVLQYAADQLKSFLFAGYDTTSIVVQWTLYELARTPHAQEALRAELDEVLGLDMSLSSIKQKLCSSGDLLEKLPYTLSAIKESLRLHPPASTVRDCPPGSGFSVYDPADGKEYNLDGCIILLNHTCMHRDPAVYGETVDEFLPERWQKGSSTSESLTAEGQETIKNDSIISPSAWRPFERGPRNCIGQELAKITACAIIAMVARRYDFTKVGLGELLLDAHGKPVLEKGQYKVKSELYNTFRATAGPVDKTRMRVTLTPQGRAAAI